ncbi:16S rRNA (cytidine(1402)-2'-O)-methyltransferase [candidate division WWE3 bacterium]|nr:16S rRNA (cytidine(1402)-2'-O)-methyltransferase [candidate division WWE3 bacterium]
MSERGALYVVSTPIGNLTDITLRAIEVLKSVDIVLSEDTRETKKVFDKYEIKTHQRSYRDQNHDSIINDIIKMLEEGVNLALVTDSGTPVISDPGFKLVARLLSENFKVISIPGPSAVISALSISGLPSDKFTFIGFLPKSKLHRKEILQQYGKLDSTIIIYESPFRIVHLLEEINTALGNRFVCVARELTKIFEEVLRGRVADLLQRKIKEKGEFVVLIAKEGFDENK